MEKQNLYFTIACINVTIVTLTFFGGIFRSHFPRFRRTITLHVSNLSVNCLQAVRNRDNNMRSVLQFRRKTVNRTSFVRDLNAKLSENLSRRKVVESFLQKNREKIVPRLLLLRLKHNAFYRIIISYNRISVFREMLNTQQLLFITILWIIRNTTCNFICAYIHSEIEIIDSYVSVTYD